MIELMVVFLMGIFMATDVADNKIIELKKEIDKCQMQIR